MDIKKAYAEWYKTEGIRTFPMNGEHFHDFYTRIAFEAGYKVAIDSMNQDMEVLEARVSDIKKSIRRVIAHNK